MTGRSAGMTLPPQTLVGRAAPGGPVDDLVVEDGRWATKPGEVVLATGGDLGGIGLLGRLDSDRRHRVAPADADRGRARELGHRLGIGVGRPGRTPGPPRRRRCALRSRCSIALPAPEPTLRCTPRPPLVTAALPRGAVSGTMSYYTAKVRENGNIAPFVPFLLAFGILGILMSVLIVANVVGGAVVSGYRRIGILKSLGFTPAQVALAYAAQIALPALVGCLIGVGAGNLLAVPLLRQNADVYGVGRLGVPIWVDVAVPVGICVLAALAALLPALRAGRLSTVQAIAIGRAPQSGRGYGAHRLLGRMPLPRAITIGLAAPFARPARTLLTLAAVLLGATAVTFAVGLTSSLKRVVDGISHRAAEPVQIAMPGSGRVAGPKRVKIGTPIGRPGRQTSPAAAEQAILAAVRGQPATAPRRRRGRRPARRRRALAAGSGDGVPRSGRMDGVRPRQRPLVHRPESGRRPDGLPHPDRHGGRRHDRDRPGTQPAARQDRRRGLRHARPRREHRHELGDAPGDRPRARTRPVRRGPAPGDVGHRLRECDRPHARPQLSRRAERRMAPTSSRQ